MSNFRSQKVYLNITDRFCKTANRYLLLFSVSVCVIILLYFFYQGSGIIKTQRVSLIRDLKSNVMLYHKNCEYNHYFTVIDLISIRGFDDFKMAEKLECPRFFNQNQEWMSPTE